MKNKLAAIREPHYSPTKFIKQARNTFIPSECSKKFVPFVHERDGMGRLIKPEEEPDSPTLKALLSQQSTEAALTYTCTPQTCVSLSEKVDFVEELINRSFQFHEPRQIKVGEGNKIKIHKKSVPSVRKYSGQELTIPTMQSQPGETRGRFLSSDLTEQKAVGYDFTQKDIGNDFIQRSHSLPRLKLINQKTGIKTKTQSKYVEVKTDRSSPLQILKKKVKTPLQKLVGELPKQRIVLPANIARLQQGIPMSLSSYKRWPKLNDHIQQANEVFLTKMREGKKLAYKLKISLQAEEWLQQ